MIPNRLLTYVQVFSLLKSDLAPFFEKNSLNRHFCSFWPKQHSNKNEFLLSTGIKRPNQRNVFEPVTAAIAKSPSSVVTGQTHVQQYLIDATPARVSTQVASTYLQLSPAKTVPTDPSGSPFKSRKSQKLKSKVPVKNANPGLSMPIFFAVRKTIFLSSIFNQNIPFNYRLQQVSRWYKPLDILWPLANFGILRFLFAGQRSRDDEENRKLHSTFYWWRHEWRYCQADRRHSCIRKRHWSTFCWKRRTCRWQLPFQFGIISEFQSSKPTHCKEMNLSKLSRFTRQEINILIKGDVRIIRYRLQFANWIWDLDCLRRSIEVSKTCIDIFNGCGTF